MANALWTVRTVLFGVTLVFSLITLGLAAGYIGTLLSLASGYSIAVPDFSALSLAIALVTLIVMAPMFVIDFIRRNAFTSWIVVEVAVTGVLSVLWLATAADTASATLGLSVDCSGNIGEAATLCRSYQAIEAFAFLNWIILFVYHGGLLGMALYAMIKGNKMIWRGTVRDSNFFAKPSNEYPAGSAPQLAYGQQPYQMPYSPQQHPQGDQYQYPPQSEIKV